MRNLKKGFHLMSLYDWVIVIIMIYQSIMDTLDFYLTHLNKQE